MINENPCWHNKSTTWWKPVLLPISGIEPQHGQGICLIFTTTKSTTIRMKNKTCQLAANAIEPPNACWRKKFDHHNIILDGTTKSTTLRNNNSNMQTGKTNIDIANKFCLWALFSSNGIEHNTTTQNKPCLQARQEPRHVFLSKGDVVSQESGWSASLWDKLGCCHLLVGLALDMQTNVYMRAPFFLPRVVVA